MKFSNLIFSLSIIILILAVSPAQSATIHVPADQPNIQAGIDAAISGDTVLVADGTYTGPGNRDIDFGGKSVVLKSENGPEVTIIDSEGSSSDRHRGFNFHSGEDSTAVVDGFTIQSGFGPSDGSYEFSVGGGSKCDSSSSPKIINNTISGNSATFGGGGISCWDNSNPTISNNTISGNSAGDGGGIFCSRNSNPTISANTISGNSASDGGGGIYCEDNSSPTISANTISRNSARSGGGIACVRFNSNPTISANTISGNSASGSGGGIYSSNSDPTISANTISDNSAHSGGGIYCHISSSTIRANIISGNSAGVGPGGGISCLFSNPTISANTISDNSAHLGGGIACQFSNPTISANTISGNSAITNGAGLFLEFNSFPSVEYSVFAFNSGSEAIWCSDEISVLTLTCCDVYGNAGGDWVGCIADQLGTNGNFSLDPLFCDTAVGDLHLHVISPCVAGHNSCGVLIGALGVGCSAGYVCADANGDSLVNVDDVEFLMNFYFYGGATPFPYLLSDMNCDGSVNIADITYLAAYINGTGAPPCCAE